jgi:hypothetical protein
MPRFAAGLHSHMPIRLRRLLLVTWLLPLAFAGPAAAQTCVTSGSDLTCSNAGDITLIDAQNNSDPGTTRATNSGNISDYLSATTNGNGVTTVSNSGNVGEGVYAATFGSGNGTTTATNSGTIGEDLTAQTTGNGASSVSNTGRVNQYLYASTAGDGITTAVNSGTVGAELRAETLGSGRTFVSNSGSIGSYVYANTTGNGTTIVTNSGSIGAYIYANTSGNGSTLVTNFGRVHGYLEAIAGTEGDATVINTGSIGSYVSATVNGNGSVAVNNAGSIGEGLYAAAFGSGSVTVSNSGSIGEDLTATSNGNGSVNVTNSGRVARYVSAVNYGDGTTKVVNSGSIWQGVQISTQGVGTSQLVNSGFITNTAGPLAVDMSGSNPTLTLLPGSIIVGGISLTGTNSAVAMNTGNQNLTFASLAGVGVSGSAPFVVSGNRIVSVDSTGFAMRDRGLADFTRDIAAAIPQITTPGSGGASPALAFASPAARIENAFAALPGLATATNAGTGFGDSTVIHADGSTTWARGFAGQRIQPSDGAAVRAQNLFYGGMIGGDMATQGGLRVGGFFGMGSSRTSLDLNFGSSQSDVVFGGAYAHHHVGESFLRAVLQFGGSRNSNTRTINNNLVGLETASAAVDGWYVSPEFTIGRNLALGRLADASYVFTPTLRLRYLYGAYGGYTETGTTAPLTVGRQTISALEQRGEFKLTRTVVFRSDQQLSTSLHAGVLGTQRTGGSGVDALLLGQPLFISAGARQAWAGFGGAGLEWRTRNVGLFSTAEYLAFSDGASLATGRAGLRIDF